MFRRSSSVHPKRRVVLRIAASIAVVLVVILAFLATTDNIRVWPYRNTLQYYVFQAWWSWFPSQSEGTGTLAGTVRDRAGTPIAGARVLVAAADGTPYAAETDAQGAWSITAPAGRYVPVAGAPGYDNTAIRRGGWQRVGVAAGQRTAVDIVLDPVAERTVVPAQNWQLGAPRTLRIEQPLPATAEERTITYTVDDRPNQTTLYYTPVGGAATLPTLLLVYPGPADTWAHVSLTLAQEGYAVIATGPAYALDLEPDVDDLERLIDAVNAGQLPRADARRIGVLGGSYSSLHVFRLLERGRDEVDSALVLGPPTDLFELRRQFEAGTFFPPFGLDQALIALGFPDRVPERYWRYSPRYHARQYNVPVMLIHSKVDEVVPFTQSQLLADELARLGKPAELHILEGMGHYLLEPKRTPAIDNLFATTLDFFAYTLR
jgi:pimeloyl-ACP methyl ester carboxylesterase